MDLPLEFVTSPVSLGICANTTIPSEHLPLDSRAISHGLLDTVGAGRWAALGRNVQSQHPETTVSIDSRENFGRV
jgi:hypothetical protein